MRLIHLVIAAAAVTGPAYAQNSQYVTDSLKLEARSGPGIQNRIVRMLESGTRVSVVERSSGWSRVTLSNGEEAWILDRYLMDDPPARGQLESAQQDLKAAQEKAAALQDKLQQLQAENTDLQESRDAFVAQAQTVAAELAEIKRTAASSIAIRDENRTLQEKVQSLGSQLGTLERDYTVLRDARSRDWFIAGAGVLFGGMVLGLIIPKIRWKRRRGWGEL